MNIKTKRNIGDEVFWVGYDGNWHNGRIIGIFITDNKIRYVLPELKTKERICAIYVDEPELFSSKEQLLKNL